MLMSSVCRQVLQLSSIPGLGLKRFYELRELAGSIEALFANPEQFLPRIDSLGAIGMSLKRCLLGELGGDADAYLKLVVSWLEASESRHVVCVDDALYPTLLNEIFQPPPLLYLEGDLSVLASGSMAVVGSRKPTLTGLRHTQNFCTQLSQAGLAITSGLALGIDAAAHRAALAAGGATIAVLATGLDRIYPRQHESLAQEITAQGLLISEMKLGTAPLPGNFPRRNRLVSGLSSGVLVVEAGLKSGSLITARYAIEQNRDLFAIPGSIDSQTSKGCNALIKDGAKLVESVEDVLPDFQLLGGPKTFVSEEDGSKLLSELGNRVLMELETGICDLDRLSELLDVEVPDMLQTLLDLELRGWIGQVPGGYELLKPLNLRA